MVGDLDRASADALIVDDHPNYRAGLHALLSHEPRLRSITEAGDVASALALVHARPFDLAIVDVVLPETGGAALIAELGVLQPRCRVLVLSMVDEPIRIAEMLRAGATGYALKSQPLDDILPAVRRVLDGHRYLPPEISPAAVFEGQPLPLECLTARERAVFDLVVQGLRTQAVADRLAISCRTIDTHRRNIMQKLGARSIVDLLLIARRYGALAPR